MKLNILQYLFPQVCPFCESEEGDSEFGLCAQCGAKMELLDPASEQCMRRDSDCYVCAVYSGRIASAIISFKKGRLVYKAILPLFIPHIHAFLSLGREGEQGDVEQKEQAGVEQESAGQKRQESASQKGVEQKEPRAARQEVAEHAKRGRVILSHPPGSMKSRLKRGFDHMALVCRIISRQVQGSEYRSLFIRHASASQKSLNKEDRKKNMEKAISIRKSGLAGIAKDACILIVDDVITTGATLSKARDLLKDEGYTNVRCLALLSD